MSKRLASLLVAAILALLAVQAATAAFPGRNGDIVFGTLHAGEDEIWVMKPDGSDRRNLTRHDGRGIADIDPRWSPDGGRIAYSSDEKDGRQIWVMNGDGSDRRRITHLPGFNLLPSWTADGRQIVFEQFDSGTADVYRIDDDGTNLVNLTSHAAVDWSPATSPRGKKVVFTSDRDGNGHLYVLTPDGALQRITDSAGYDYFANWSPHGNDIVFTREEAGETDLFLVHNDGSGERRLTSTPGRNEYYPVFAPDGRKVAYSACGGFPVPWHPRCWTEVLDLASGAVTDLSFPTLALPNPYLDGFDDGVRDVDVWQLLHEGVGGFFAETNGRIEMSLDAVPGENIRVATDFHCLLLGDFDVQVDYTLLTWPPANGVNVQLHAFLDDATLARLSQTWGEGYSAWSGFGSAFVPTTDLVGSLRLVRSGSTMASYYRTGVDWTLLQSTAAGGGKALIVLEAVSYGTFAGQPVKVAFDNFRIDAADRDCSSWRPDWHPDWQSLSPRP